MSFQEFISLQVFLDDYGSVLEWTVIAFSAWIPISLILFAQKIYGGESVNKQGVKELTIVAFYVAMAACFAVASSGEKYYAKKWARGVIEDSICRMREDRFTCSYYVWSSSKL